jgi:hypothetical protein
MLLFGERRKVMNKICQVLGKVVIFMLFLISNSFANTIFDVYVSAMLNPYTFEQLLAETVVNNPNYYQKYFRCSDLAKSIINQAMQQIRQQISLAPGDRIPLLNNELTEQIEFHRTISWLDQVIRRHQRGERNFYLETDLANAAIILINVAQENGIDPRYLLSGRFAALQLIPCE